jgi:hypothetical protein
VLGLVGVAAAAAVAVVLWSPWEGSGDDYGFLTRKQARLLVSDVRKLIEGPPSSRVEEARVYRSTWARFSRLTGDHMRRPPRQLLILVLHGRLLDCGSGPGVNPCSTSGDFFRVYRPRPLVGLMGGLGRHPWGTLGRSVELDLS